MSQPPMAGPASRKAIGPHELVERVGLREVGGGQDVRDDRVEGRGEERGAGAVHGDERDDVPELELPVSVSAASTADGRGRIRSAATITRRRSKRSETAPPTSSSTIVGTVIAIPTNESAVGAFDSG